MTFNLDQEISRQGTNSTKWEFEFGPNGAAYSDRSDPKYGAERLLPMWVADMDFRCPPAVVEALVARAQHGLFGYTTPTADYYDAFIGWVQRRHGWTVQADWVVITPGVVPALNMMVQTYTQPGDKILIQRPVYHPFTFAIENNGRVVVSNSLVAENGRYSIDFDDFAAKAADPDVKMFVLCSPHNPVGRVWTREELTRMGEICFANDVLVVSDEIHCDLIQPEYTFVPFGSISDEFAQRSISCMAPSKTFNLAGLKTSHVMIPDVALRNKLNTFMNNLGVKGINAFGLVSTQTAYTHGDAWLDEVIGYIGDNYRYMASFLADNLPQLCLSPLEGTYLSWLDCRALELDKDELKALLYDQAHLFFNQGYVFGNEGDGFVRINLACPRSLVVEAMDRLKTAVLSLQPA